MKIRNSKAGVTLLEMLTVVMVIAILAGMVFKLFNMATRTAERAQTVAKVESLAMAINEYKAVYGSYPPVDPAITSVTYYYENWDLQTTAARREIERNQNLDITYTYGLMSFLVPRFQGSNVTFNGHVNHFEEWEPGMAGNWQAIEDTARDLAAKESWANFLREILYSNSTGTKRTPIGKFLFRNSYITVNDAWGRGLLYKSRPPHQSYILWSVGPDGANDEGKGDDIATGTMQ
jgi:prepilin-type N-terminal cleavage/methylation domain-containing protein